MNELEPVAMTIQLLGGLALFLYGMEKMTDGLKAAAGNQMNMLLARLTGNRILGAITGAIVTAVIQSSSVTTVLVVGFVSAGLLTLVQSVGVIFGANVGTTVTAQIVAFNTTALAFPFIAIGFVMSFVWKQGVARHYGAMLMGLGLLFYGMATMGAAMAPLRTNQSFAELLQSLQNPVLGMLAGALFTALVQSSSATIGLAVVMATQGLLSLPAGIAILFGAKIGTGITAILAGIGKPQDAKRAAVVHVLFNVLGALIWLPFIPQLAMIAQAVSPLAAHLEGVARLAEEVPRQIANAATIWAVANTVIFLPFAALFAKLATRIVPDRVLVQKEIIRPKYLDDAMIAVPSMALERARMELGHMSQLTNSMLAKVQSAFVARDLGELAQQFDQIVVLREAVLNYLQHIGRSALSDVEAEEHARLVAATGEIESMSAAISRELVPLAQALEAAQIAPSKETKELLERLVQIVLETAQAALRALVERDEQAAQSVVAKRAAILDLSEELQRQQAARLAQDDPNRLTKYRIQIEMLDKLRRLYGVSEHMAISVLPRSVLVGELYS
ncbi:Na/Pi cotransporter family protein [Roseateles albus]|uniref:Na/Pi cotransporter family protein n=1 Tax=Roseateles albus TaxID=2987525 RepID=A0ABT5KGC0_9BURK|nr:Na/Pi cotransporter family protein [Roseateles albus]MDC8772970.1 Na/Pi cotransporter family protein [Roseateles albus]